MTGEVRRREHSWVPLGLDAASSSHEVTIRFEAHPAPDGAVITYFVSGFFLHAIDDQATRQDFVEAVALRRLDSLNAFRER